MSKPGDFNAHTIAEFRKNRGKVGGYFEGAPLLLLNSVGKRSGKTHVTPVMYLKDGERYYVFASKAGADTHPDWYNNIKAHPDIKIEVGDETLDVHAEEIVGRDRDAIYRRQATLFPSFADYERKTKRVIPVIALTKRKK
jgi:deazaflavin-dependent oxidoreductase (nitroreductase family)